MTNGSVEVIAVCLDQTVEFCEQPKDASNEYTHFQAEVLSWPLPISLLSDCRRKQENSEEKLHSTLKSGTLRVMSKFFLTIRFPSNPIVFTYWYLFFWGRR